MHGSSLDCAIPTTSTGQIQTMRFWELGWVRRSRAGRTITHATAVGLLMMGVRSGLLAQSNIVGSVELYGARSVSPDEIRRAVGLSPGDAVPADSRALVERVRRVRGVVLCRRPRLRVSLRPSHAEQQHDHAHYPLAHGCTPVAAVGELIPPASRRQSPRATPRHR